MLALRLLSEGGEGPNTELQWILLVGIAFFFLIVIVGWLTSSRKQEQVEAGHEAKKSAKKDADELTKIEGVGPKVVKILKEAGITTFDELARAKAGDLQKALDAAGLHMMNPESWAEQAKLAAKGDWQKLEKLQAELKGGRKAK
jgi:large subunit ribosomal protein L21